MSYCSHPREYLVTLNCTSLANERKVSGFAKQKQMADEAVGRSAEWLWLIHCDY